MFTGRNATMIKMLMSAALASAALAAAPAAAQDVAASKTLVAYGDLNIGNAAGALRSTAASALAARSVCGVEQAPGFAEMSMVRDCRVGAIRAANAEVEQVLASRSVGSNILVAARR
jgi:UrcA family protein